MAGMTPEQERAELYQRWEGIERQLVALESQRPTLDAAEYARRQQELREARDAIERRLNELWQEQGKPLL